MSDTYYEQLAQQQAERISKFLSERTGKSLKFNGYARGANIFIETADVETTIWAAIDNPLNQLAALGNPYASIRRTRHSNKSISYTIFNLVLSPDIAHPGSCLRFDQWIGVNSEVIEQLIAQEKIFVGELKDPHNNTDDLSDYQRDYFWTENPWFQFSHLSAIARLAPEENPDLIKAIKSVNEIQKILSHAIPRQVYQESIPS